MIEYDQLVKFQFELREYTSLCFNILVIIFLPAHLFYFLPNGIIPIFEKFCRYDHVTLLFSKSFILLGFCSLVVIFVFILGIFIVYHDSSFLRSPIPEDINSFRKFERVNEIRGRLKRMFFTLVVIEIWNLLIMAIPIYSVIYFFTFTRPNGEYFVDILIKPNVLKSARGLLANYVDILDAITQDSSNIGKRSSDTVVTTISIPVSDFEKYSENIFYAHVLAPILALIQIFIFCCALVVLFIHFSFIKTIIKLFKFLKFYKNYHKNACKQLRRNSFRYSEITDSSYEQPRTFN